MEMMRMRKKEETMKMWKRKKMEEVRMEEMREGVERVIYR
jgi:hypothetical protein